MITNLPPHWTSVRLSDVCLINPRGASGLSETDEVSFVPMVAVSEVSGTITSGETVPFGQVMKGFTPFQEGDVLFAKITPCMENGKAAIARGLVNQRGYGSTEFHVLRPSGLVLAEWIFALIRTADFRRAAAASFQGAVGQQRVPASFLQGFRIPVPPLSEQHRIVEILREAEEIRRLRTQAETKTAELIPALFHQFFGAPDEWGQGFKLGDLVTIVGGGTPSRSIDHFFTGDIPWATSKDIKKLYLDDAEEHITEEAVRASATNVVPGGTVLVVVKSKILMHSLPVAITQVPMCFGQDIKGLIPQSGISPEFIVYSLQAQLPKILSRARGANTEGLTLEALKSLNCPKPTPEIIDRFKAAVIEANSALGAIFAANHCGDTLAASLSAHAFSGELTASWREIHADTLATEARERDAALAAAGATTRGRRANISEIDSIFSDRTDGIYAELTAEQREVLRAVEQGYAGVHYARYFSARDIAERLEYPLRRNAQVVEGHLQVLATRGLLIGASREEQDEMTGQYRYANAYRLPLSDFHPQEGDPREPRIGDRSRATELERLVARIEKERMMS